jgi:hypothetical protein
MAGLRNSLSTLVDGELDKVYRSLVPEIVKEIRQSGKCSVGLTLNFKESGAEPAPGAAMADVEFKVRMSKGVTQKAKGCPLCNQSMESLVEGLQ